MSYNNFTRTSQSFLPVNHGNQMGNATSIEPVIKKKGKGRVARFMNRNPDIESVIKASQSGISNGNYQRASPYVQRPQTTVDITCKVSSDSISFFLPPKYQRLECKFDHIHPTDQRLGLSVSQPNVVVDFSINQVEMRYTGSNVDITDYLKTGRNILMFSTFHLTTPITVVLKWQQEDSVNMLVKSILARGEKMPTPISSDPCTNICPLSGTEMSYPARGVNCQHLQCFDLATFIRRSYLETRNDCPVCHKHIELSELRYDGSYIDTIAGFSAIGNDGDIFDDFDMY